jgi:diaminopimelate decarboxylase
LRKAFPELTLIGVDHWHGSSGLHHDAVNDVLVLPQWKQIDNKRHAAFLKDLLNEGNIWISAIDTEVYWLAQNFGSHKNLMAPSGTALEMTSKPFVRAFESLGFKVPESISAFSADSEIHAFLRHNSWQCWLKGPYHDAKRITSWDSFERARDSMQKDWKTSRLFLQKHMYGNEESICFSAIHGQLLGCVHMQKRLITPEGKTWAGKINPVGEKFFADFQEIIQELEWSGGGEIEFARDLDGNKWIIECNPRFPAWIYGSSLVGHNLPARIVSEALNLPLIETVQDYACFTRVVQEIPAKESLGLPYPVDPSLLAWSADTGKGKGGPSPHSFMPRLRDTMVQKLHSDNDLENDEEDNEELFSYDQKIPEAYSEEVKDKARSFLGETPVRLHLDQWTQSKFESLVSHIKKSHSSPAIRIGYSVKTSPTDDHLRHARNNGFLTECISQMEIKRALSAGVANNEIILNGPGKFWPITEPPITGLHMIFADSIEEFERIFAIPNIAKVIGFRIHLPNLQSRFGIPVDELEDFQKIVSCAQRLQRKAELGFHFHLPSWTIGVKRWKEALNSLITWCEAIEQLTGTPVKHLDLGGGFFPSDLEQINFRWVQRSVKESLPNVKAIYFEPGRSLTQEGEIIVSRILDVRKDKDGKLDEVVVDACIAELPLISSYHHRVFFQPQNSNDESTFSVLKKGKTKVLGRICMENDILSRGLTLPENVQLGDYIIFGDAGAYERTMSYEFGRG